MDHHENVQYPMLKQSHIKGWRNLKYLFPKVQGLLMAGLWLWIKVARATYPSSQQKLGFMGESPNPWSIEGGKICVACVRMCFEPWDGMGISPCYTYTYLYIYR